MKKLSKLKLHNAILLNDNEMKNIVGGYDLDPVYIYGTGPDYCSEHPGRFGVPVQCDETMARHGSRCRSSDCRQIGQCWIVPISMVPKCKLGYGDHGW